MRTDAIVPRGPRTAVLMALMTLTAGCVVGPGAPATSSGPAVVATTSAPVDERLAREQAEMERNRELIEKLRGRGLLATASERGALVTLPDALFQYGRAELAWGARRTLADLADVMRNDATGRPVTIEGYTDSVGPDDFNQHLSERRAATVREVLTNEGVPSYLLTATGLGEANPVAPNTHPDGTDNPAGRSRNRRVEVTIGSIAAE